MPIKNITNVIADRIRGCKEIVICSAIKTETGKVIRGHRHNNCLNLIHELHLSHINSIQGFITSKNRFVDRQEGYDLQIKAGVKSSHPSGYCRSGELYSEDLY